MSFLSRVLFSLLKMMSPLIRRSSNPHRCHTSWRILSPWFSPATHKMTRKSFLAGNLSWEETHLLIVPNLVRACHSWWSAPPAKGQGYLERLLSWSCEVSKGWKLWQSNLWEIGGKKGHGVRVGNIGWLLDWEMLSGSGRCTKVSSEA